MSPRWVVAVLVAVAAVCALWSYRTLTDTGPSEVRSVDTIVAIMPGASMAQRDAVHAECGDIASVLEVRETDTDVQFDVPPEASATGAQLGARQELLTCVGAQAGVSSIGYYR